MTREGFPVLPAPTELPAGQAARRRRHWSDFVGAAVFGSLAVVNLITAPAVTLLILPNIAHELIVAIAFFTRQGAAPVRPAWFARVLTYVSAFVVPVTMTVAAARAPELLARTDVGVMYALGVGIWALGSVLVFWPIWELRRYFALEPAARGLQTSGPYRFARHPIYATYLLMYVGIVLQRPSWLTVTMFAIWALATVPRARQEELVLERCFPEYADYRERIGALWPKPGRPLPGEVRA